MKQDHGITALDAIVQALEIDARWSDRGDRYIKWWGHKLAQEITADPPLGEDGVWLTRLHAKIDLVRNPTRKRDINKVLAGFNALAAHSPIIWDSKQQTIQFCASVYLHDTTSELMSNHFNHICALQASDAKETAELLQNRFGGEICQSTPPHGEPRNEPDEVLSLIDRVYAPVGDGPSPFGGDDFYQAIEVVKKCGMKGSVSDVAFSFEIPFCGEGRTAMMCALDGGPLETVLVQGRNETHPQLGNGLLLRATTLMSHTGGDDVDRAANELNLAESRRRKGAALVGAWCALEGELVYVCFVPALLHQPQLTAYLCMEMIARIDWAAHEVLNAPVEALS